MISPEEIMITMKDIVDDAVRTRTWDELCCSGSWKEYEFRCKALGLDPIMREAAILYYAYRPKELSVKL